MQVVMNKCCLLNPEKKIGADPSCCFREKRKTHILIPKNDVTEPKASNSNNQLNCKQFKSQFQGFRKP